jgi:hypothetical protein
MHMPIPKILRSIMLRQIMLKQHHFDEKLREAARMAKAEFDQAKRGSGNEPEST